MTDSRVRMFVPLRFPVPSSAASRRTLRAPVPPPPSPPSFMPSMTAASMSSSLG